MWLTCQKFTQSSTEQRYTHFWLVWASDVAQNLKSDCLDDWPQCKVENNTWEEMNEPLIENKVGLTVFSTFAQDCTDNIQQLVNMVK